jgi:5'-nucleotidase / UDP-sugar diphosphatase
VAGQPLDPERTYRIAISDFLMTGREGGIEFLTRDAAGVGKVTELRDIRFAVIEEIQRRWGAARTGDLSTSLEP